MHAVTGSRHRVGGFGGNAIAGHARGCATTDQFWSGRDAFSRWTEYKSKTGTYFILMFAVKILTISLFLLYRHF